MAAAREREAGFISIDGKTIRGSENAEHPPVHVVSAWAGEEEIVLGQVAVTVTIDASKRSFAMCQTEIAAKIRKQGADYVLAVKDNQKTLHEDIKDYFEGLEQRDIRELPDDIWEIENRP